MGATHTHVVFALLHRLPANTDYIYFHHHHVLLRKLTSFLPSFETSVVREGRSMAGSQQVLARHDAGNAAVSRNHN